MMLRKMMTMLLLVTFLTLRCELTMTQHQWPLPLLPPTSLLNPVLDGLLLLLNRFLDFVSYLNQSFWLVFDSFLFC